MEDVVHGVLVEPELLGPGAPRISELGFARRIEHPVAENALGLGGTLRQLRSLREQTDDLAIDGIDVDACFPELRRPRAEIRDGEPLVDVEGVDRVLRRRMQERFIYFVERVEELVPGVGRERIFELDGPEEMPRVGAYRLDRSENSLERCRREGDGRGGSGVDHPIGDEEGEGVRARHQAIVLAWILLDDLAPEALEECARARCGFGLHSRGLRRDAPSRSRR